MKKLACRDAGFNWDHEIVAETVEEILQSAAEHVQTVHGLEVTPDMAAQVIGLIQEVEV